MEKPRFYITLVMSLALAWFMATIFIDFFAVPEVFKQVSSRDEAAALGIKIFNKFNYIEVIVAFVILGSSSLLYFKKEVKFYLLAIAFIILLFPLSYIQILTPKITKYNLQKIDDPYNDKIQKQLDFYHQAYVKMDSVKIVILLNLIIYTNILIYRKEE